MLKNIHRILKPGGVFAVTTPNIGSLPAKILGKRWEEIRRVREHIYFFSDKTLTKMLRSTGFEILENETAGRIFSCESATRRIYIYYPKLSKILASFTRILNLNNLKVYIDPRYKITVYARKNN